MRFEEQRERHPIRRRRCLSGQPHQLPTKEPEVRLSDWQILETDAGSRHFVGFNIRLREGRVSSAIVTFDAKARTGVTRSGRIYKLEGEPSTDPDAAWTWAGWKQINGVKSKKIVTDQALKGE